MKRNTKFQYENIQSAALKNYSFFQVKRKVLEKSLHQIDLNLSSEEIDYDTQLLNLSTKKDGKGMPTKKGALNLIKQKQTKNRLFKLIAFKKENVN